MPVIRYFQIVGDVITANIQSLADQRGVARDLIYQEVVNHIAENSRQWMSNQMPVIHYENPLCRIAYLYGIVSVNANLIEFIFQSDPELSDYVDLLQRQEGQVNICVFGGGPGTELLGLTKWIENRNYGQQFWFNFLLLDCVPEWIDSWQGMNRQIEARFRANIGPNRNTWPVVSSGYFSSVDFTNISNFANLGNVFGQSLYIFSYVISEVFSNFGDFERFIELMVSHAPQGSKFLFIDRNGDIWKNETRNIARQAGLSLSAFHSTRRPMDNDERKEDLGTIYSDVGRNPRTTWNSFWVVGTKI